MKIETLLSPAELPALAGHDLHTTACVVFDILRATSTFVTALQNGAKAVIPVGEISEAVAVRQKQPDVLLAGERDGVKIHARHSGGLDFDFGNSPREFTPGLVDGRIIVSTTTNGTRALRACAAGKTVLAASFLNLAATAKFLQHGKFAKVLLICAGTGEGVALEDVLAAGALADALNGEECDATKTARHTFSHASSRLPAAIAGSTNGRRLLAIPALHDDVAFCSQRDVADLVARLDANGHLMRA